MSEPWNECKHEWEAKQVFNAFGWAYEDVCKCCGSVGMVSEKPDANGIYQIVARPWAKVYILDEYRKRREEKANEQKDQRIVGS